MRLNGCQIFNLIIIPVTHNYSNNSKTQNNKTNNIDNNTHHQQQQQQQLAYHGDSYTYTRELDGYG